MSRSPPEFEFDELPAGSKQAFRMTVSLEASCDLLDTAAMISGDRSSRQSVRAEIDAGEAVAVLT